jgi:putative ABC transport system permease protein
MTTWLNDARRDAALAVRLLLRHPIVAVTAVLSLAIGIGANSAIFTVANALLYRAPAGVTEADRLVDIGIGRPDGGFNPGNYPTYLDIRQRSVTLGGVYAQTMFPQAVSFVMTGSGASPERVYAQRVTTNYFTVLGVGPAAGRLFGAIDSEQPGAAPVAVLSHRFWTRRFDADPSVVGRTVRINDVAYAIAGVAPEGFQGTGVTAGDLWLPLTMTAASPSSAASGAAPRTTSVFENRRSAWLVMGGRLKPGTTLETAEAEIATISRDLQREHPRDMEHREIRVVASSMIPGNRGVIAGFMVLLLVIVGLVLLVACANVSGVMLSRAVTRRREMAVRVAMGARRGRLVRQLLAETMVLFLSGGAAGVVLAYAMTGLVVSSLPSLPFPIAVSLAPDLRVIALTIGLSLAAALFSGLLPAVQGSNADPVTAMKDDAQGPSRRAWLRHAFVVAQIAGSVVLVVTAGLFVRALERAGTVNPGYDARGVELASIDLSMANYSEAAGLRFARELAARVRQLPNVESATISRNVPGGFETMGVGITVPGVREGWIDEFEPEWNVVEPGYFATLRMQIVAGRDFTEADRQGTQPVLIVGEAAARYFWPGKDPIGQQVLQHVGGQNGLPENATKTLTVIGVVRDFKSTSMIDGLSASCMYLPLQQHYVSNMVIVARSANGQRLADRLRTAVASIDANLPIVQSQTLDEHVSLGRVPQRIIASVSGSLGLVGLLLAAVGVYGVMAFAVTLRTREFGIRVALGAQGRDVVRMVLRQGLWSTGLGCAIGFGLAALLARPLTAVLLDVPALDPVAFGGSAALCVVAAAAACYGPARRAVKSDPMAALRRD